MIRLSSWMTLWIFFVGGFCQALQQQQQSSVVRLMSYNIQAWRDSQHQDSFDRIVDCVKQTRPDILCLNEVLHPFYKPPNYDGDYYRQIQSKQRGVRIPESFLPANDDEQQYSSFLHQLAEAVHLPNVEYVGATARRKNPTLARAAPLVMLFSPNSKSKPLIIVR
jgi:endonuclease/exonuclease/phosphatase family metal-dependent hydrolase